jgi:hypothetical protein
MYYFEIEMLLYPHYGSGTQQTNNYPVNAMKLVC